MIKILFKIPKLLLYLNLIKIYFRKIPIKINLEIINLLLSKSTIKIINWQKMIKVLKIHNSN